MIDLEMWGHYCQECASLYEDHSFAGDLCPYPAQTRFVAYMQMPNEEEPRCEYRSPQFDGGTQQGRMIQCRNKAAMWTDRGLRCEDHKGD